MPARPLVMVQAEVTLMGGDMRTSQGVLAAAFAAALLGSTAAQANQVLWGFQAENVEYRFGESEDVAAWDFDFFVGTDELKVVWRSEAEFSMDEREFETLENQLRLQVPIGRFFDAVAGVRVDTPKGTDRAYGVVGLKGLAPQWFEIDADLYISDRPVFRFEGEYEALITNRIILTPSLEFTLPLRDDPAIGVAGFGPIIEVGARLSYDLIDRAVAPYIGVHYERSFGGTADILRAAGKDAGALFGVVGVRLMY